MGATFSFMKSGGSGSWGPLDLEAIDDIGRVSTFAQKRLLLQHAKNGMFVTRSTRALRVRYEYDLRSTARPTVYKLYSSHDGVSSAIGYWFFQEPKNRPAETLGGSVSVNGPLYLVNCLLGEPKFSGTNVVVNSDLIGTKMSGTNMWIET